MQVGGIERGPQQGSRIRENSPDNGGGRPPGVGQSRTYKRKRVDDSSNIKRRRVDYKTVRNWGSSDSEEIHHMLTEKGYEFEVSENSVLIKNQESNLVEVKAHLENKVTKINNVFCCELKDNGDIEVTRMNKIRFDREKKEREIQASLGDLPWGSIDRAEIHRMLTEKGYKFEVSENSVLIKNQGSNLEAVKAHLENKLTPAGMVFSCELQDNGDISVTRKYISPTSLKYLEIGRDVEDSVELAKIKQEELLTAGYFLNEPKNIKLLLENAKHILAQFPTGRIFGLGQSPAWILEAAKYLDTEPSRISSVAFSGRMYNENLLPDYTIPFEKNLGNYYDYLNSIGLSPEAIVKNPIVLVEQTHSGAGLKSFLSVLKTYAEREGVSILELDNSIHVHLVVGKDCDAHLPQRDPKFLNVKSVQFTEQKFCVDMGNSDNYGDRLVPHYAPHEWGKPPDQRQLNQENINAIKEKLSDVAGIISGNDEELFEIVVP